MTIIRQTLKNDLIYDQTPRVQKQIWGKWPYNTSIICIYSSYTWFIVLWAVILIKQRQKWSRNNNKIEICMYATHALSFTTSLGPKDLALTLYLRWFIWVCNFILIKKQQQNWHTMMVSWLKAGKHGKIY